MSVEFGKVCCIWSAFVTGARLLEDNEIEEGNEEVYIAKAPCQ